jgi:hypothetical protein
MTHRRKDRTASLIAGRITNARLQAGFTKKVLAGALAWMASPIANGSVVTDRSTHHETLMRSQRLVADAETCNFYNL